jgi:hypothetical protein
MTEPLPFASRETELARLLRRLIEARLGKRHINHVESGR